MEDPVALIDQPDDKIKNDGKKAPASAAPEKRYEVVVSFAPFDKGEFFTADADHDWTAMVDAGYLRELTGDEPGREVPDDERGRVSTR